ncbi:CheR family methyltransferase [Undibacter mobilis]|uniref:Chemotaxis protein methyltransferase n=1 Tax=Undibacter mobilis TaxID=2292256 RepID=A0A371B7B5_9BRAD|nr:protein-glutamate O-methyltransferase CheR [Undibacter mobilis]RDV03505.1 protein-glutamate O-methyltransferase CheR [Undibacter mobilis]
MATKANQATASNLAGKARASAPAAFALPDAGDGAREFHFSDADFRGLVDLAYKFAGIALSDSKRNLVYSRLSRRLRTLGMKTFSTYREYLEETESERENFINAISTNLTKFFRESHHFDHFREQIAVPFSRNRSTNRLRVWSAGCSSGEEPHTIAMVLKREIRDVERQDVRILATDIDTEMVARGTRGEYPENSLDEVPRAYQEYFERTSKPNTLVVDRAVRSLIAFKRLNLMETWPFKGPFDAIFCRNVMIYFDGPTKAQLIERFTEKIRPGGFLYIGHSESLNGAHPGISLVGRTIYRRV